MKTKKLRVFSGIISCFLVIFVGLVYYFSNDDYVLVNNQGIQPIYNGNRNSNKVALMFNCYEGRDYVYGIANELEKFGFKATFFFGGCFADDNFDLIEYLNKKGHEIGNHGYFHKDQGKINEEGNIIEIKHTHDVIFSQTGISMNLFAPPSGSFSKTTLEVCEKLGYKMILWSVDTIDWRDKNQKIVYNRATQKVSGGDFVLMHPKEHTLKALPDILKKYFESGLIVATVTQCMENDG